MADARPSDQAFPGEFFCMHCGTSFRPGQRHPLQAYCSRRCRERVAKGNRRRLGKCLRCRRDAAVGYVHCDVHRNARATTLATQRRGNERVDRGLCYDCGKRPLASWSRRCCAVCLRRWVYRNQDERTARRAQQREVLGGRLTVGEAAKLAGVSSNVIGQRIRRGSLLARHLEIPGVHQGTTVRKYLIAASARPELEAEGRARRTLQNWPRVGEVADCLHYCRPHIRNVLARRGIPVVQLPTGEVRVHPDSLKSTKEGQV